MRNRLSIRAELEKIKCRSINDGFGSAEPYLWALFYKIDGETISFDGVSISGRATIFRMNGNQDNLSSSDVDAGDTVTIPSDVGLIKTILKPIKVPEGLIALLRLIDPDAVIPEDIPGAFGIITVLMEEDNVSASGARAGYDALCNTVENALNDLIPTMTDEESLSDIENSLTSKIQVAVREAIIENQNFVQNIWAGLDEDDLIGNHHFRFSHDEIANDPDILLKKRWKNAEHGDWELLGSLKSFVFPNSLQIVAVRTKLPESRISHVRYLLNGELETKRRSEIIRMIEDEGIGFFVLSPDGIKSIVIVNEPNENTDQKFISTIPDETEGNNLLSLPRF